MGKVYSHVARFAKNYNVSNRAYKELERQADNPASKVAPKHATTSTYLEEFTKGLYMSSIIKLKLQS